MPIITRIPTSVHTSGTWVFSTTSLVADVTDGSDVTYDENAAVADDLLFEFEDVGGVPSNSFINSVTVQSRWNNPASNATSRLRARIAAVLQSSTNHAVVGFSNFNYSGFTGLTTLSVFNSSQFGAQEVVDFGTPMRLVELSASVSYSVPSGGLIFLLLSFGPLVSVGLQEMAGLARAVARRTGHMLRPDEYAQAWRELREYRHPRFFLP